MVCVEGGGDQVLCAGGGGVSECWVCSEYVHIFHTFIM